MNIKQLSKQKGWSSHYRDDKGVWEAICPHGIGHENGIHGCDGCCSVEKPSSLLEQEIKLLMGPIVAWRERYVDSGRNPFEADDAYQLTEKLLRSFALKVRRETLEEVRIKDKEKIKCPLWVCCKECYQGAVNDRIDSLLQTMKKEKYD